MQLGMVGLGRMGANMTRRLLGAGHEVVGFDLSHPSVASVVSSGAHGASSSGDLASQLEAPRIVWIMVPHGDPVEQTLAGLLPHLAADDVVVDGGNSFYKDTIARAERLASDGIHLVDVGTSGGIWGLTEGYSLMVGGEPEPVARLRPVLEALAPTPDTGWGHVGGPGSGHFVKMIHNGIEYGLMQAYAEGFAVLRAKQELGLDLAQIGTIWQRGSVVRSWLLELTTRAIAENPDMHDVAPYVPDSGEGRWTVFEAIDLDVSTPIIGLSLLRRIGSRDEIEYSDRLLASMRHQFGGHPVRRET